MKDKYYDFSDIDQIHSARDQFPDLVDAALNYKYVRGIYVQYKDSQIAHLRIDFLDTPKNVTTPNT